LLIGDSVVNGGSLTDQDSIASTLLEKRFYKDFNKRVRILNISAGSWGPDNVAAYLKKYGTFKAKLMCLVTSSHDAHDIMSHQSPVGIDPGWPNKQYKVALYELWDRYRWIFFYYLDTLFLSPEPAEKKEDNIAIVKPDVTDSAHVASDAKASEDSINAQKLNEAGIRKPGLTFNPGYEQLYEIAKQNHIPMFIYLHPEISEIDLGHFNDQGQEIIAFAKEKDIRLIDEFQFPVSKNNYRKMDVVHFNSRGQVFLANNLYPLFQEYLNLSK
jgi:lysophospholipase L1-like esterase